LTPSQGALLYRLVELGYLTQTQVTDLINRLVSERFRKATAYLDFAPRLDAEVVLNQPHIISRCYYAMYHAARAFVLHTRRADLDDHERLPMVLSQMLGTQHGEMLGKWREVRNQVDYSPYAPVDLNALTKAALADAAALLAACHSVLRNRGMNR